ncbi:hypothetical protein ACWDR7_05755 [Microbacterium sp. NPDC003461]|jgi:hypothetical protein
MSVVPASWIPHRRASDRELLGWIRPEGEGFVAVSLFGADVSGPLDWVAAEEELEAVGLSWLADVWELELDGRAVRVRIVEVSPGESAARPGRVLVKTDDFGAIDVPYELHELPWPPPPALRPARPGTTTSPWG